MIRGSHLTDMNGLYFYRRIVSESISHLNDGAWLMFEIGHDQAEDVSKAYEKCRILQYICEKGSGRT